MATAVGCGGGRQSCRCDDSRHGRARAIAIRAITIRAITIRATLTAQAGVEPRRPRHAGHRAQPRRTSECMAGGSDPHRRPAGGGPDSLTSVACRRFAGQRRMPCNATGSDDSLNRCPMG
jgi:hypothetical protein